jgi:hypothetical protein
MMLNAMGLLSAATVIMLQTTVFLSPLHVQGQPFFPCFPGYANCDGSGGRNGCETFLLTNPNHCGRCGRRCGVGGQGSCRNGQCQPACQSPNTTCPGGECVDLQSSLNHCGGCGNACSAATLNNVATVSCIQGACALSTCKAGFQDCDASVASGCEVSVRNM